MSNFSDKRSPSDIAKIRAQQLRKVRQEVNPSRARSQYGEPVIFQKLKEKSSISRRSRVMSDPEIPSALVILNAKGLFEGKKGAESKIETSYASVDKMDEKGSKPIFCDPCNNNNHRVSDLKKRFESLERDIERNNEVSPTGSEFLNPLHKGNQAALSSARTSREVRKNEQTKLGKALNEGDAYLEKRGSLKVADSENLLQNESLDTTKITKTLPSKLDKGFEILDVSMKQSSSAPKVEDAKLKKTSTESVKELELKTPPNRPPPRAPMPSPKKEPPKSDKLGGEDAVSTILQTKEDEEESVLQQGSVLEGEQNTGSKTFSNGTVDGNDSRGFDTDDDDSDNYWGSDFDEDGDEEEEENENHSKHSSHSSHGSSCEADSIIVSKINFFYCLISF